MGVFSDTKTKDAVRQSAAALESIKNDIDVIREAQIALNKKFSYLDDRIKTALKKK